MRIFFSLFFFITVVFGADATIEVVKKVDSLPTIGVEDSSVSYDDVFKTRFFKALVSDLNVLSLFNVDRHNYITHYDESRVVVENKDKDYVLRYKLYEGDNQALTVDMKIIKNSNVVMNKSYKIQNSKLSVFVSHAIAYDVNKFMGAEPVDWMKKKILLARLVSPQQSEIVISDYTLAFSQKIVSGGLNVFPKWANKEQTAFYYTSLSGKKPSLKKVDIKTAKVENILSSDGMIVCSDVSLDSKKLLVTMAPEGQPDIYMYDVDTKKTTRLTTYSGIDVNGQFMKDNKIAFVSNRLGYPNIFSKVIGEKGVEQLVYYGKSNSSCSAHNEYIVYKSRESNDNFSDNTFNLHLISTETDFIRRLTATGMNEFPRFSQDGDAILFIKNYMEQSSIGIIRLKFNKNYLFPLSYGKIQSIDW
ncbi:Tol-Pal system protein TolB [bacterium]|nr:Tol-Pal system protein TolB [bacterium]MBU1882774.1 Tol-Pal system protein TolB [bacterium]